jgi:hypothetical protein
VERGVKVKKQLNKMLKDRGVWTEEEDKQEKALTNRIVELSNKLKNAAKHKLTKQQGRDIALKIFKARRELQQLLTERNSLYVGSAEALAENAKFDYLVSVCTLDPESGKPYFYNLDNYNMRKEEKAAWAAAAELANMLYNSVDFDENFIDNLIEVKFLKKFNFVDDKDQLVDDKGNVLDLDGNIIPKNDLEYNNGKLEFEFKESDFV